MNAFVAWTPLHVINILNTAINYTNIEESDCYIYNEFSGAAEIYQRLKEERVFREVYLVDFTNIGNQWTRISALVFNQQNLVKTEKVYDNIFIQGENYFAKLLYGQMKRKNSQLKLKYIEDGLGTYVGSPVIRQDVRANQIIKLLNRYSIYHANIDEYYVYEKDMIVQKEAADYYNLPKLVSENPAFYVIKKIFASFQYDNKMKLCDTVIFFDQPLLSDGFSVDEKVFFHKLENLTDSTSLMVKFHPRSDRNKYGDSVSVLRTQLPWELLCLESDFTNVKLISIATTAGFTPYLMYGKKIPVIMLAKLFLKEDREYGGNERTIAMLEKIITFTDLFQRQAGNIVLLPENYSELQSILISNQFAGEGN